MSQDISAWNIKKFDGTNFQVWKFQITALFSAHEIDDVVDGTRVLPEDRLAPEARAWVRDDAKAKFLISSALEAKQMEPLLTCETSKEMWDNLRRIHEQRSSANKLLLLQKFHEYRMLPGERADVGERVSELTIIAKILGSLSQKFTTLQTAWDSVKPARQTLENLEERLIREELRLLGTDSENGASAFAASRKDNKNCDKKKRNKSKQNKEDVEYYRCHEVKHYAYQCPTRKGGSGASRDCAFVVEKARGEKRAPSKFELPSDGKLRELLTVKQSDAWLIDSGASRHITYPREWLTDYRPTKNAGTVALGDGKEYNEHPNTYSVLNSRNEEEKQRRKREWQRQKERDRQHEKRKQRKILEYERKRAQRLKYAEEKHSRHSRSKSSSASPSHLRYRGRSTSTASKSGSLHGKLDGPTIGTMPAFRGPQNAQIETMELRRNKVDIHRNIPVKGPVTELERYLDPKDVIVNRREVSRFINNGRYAISFGR